MIEKGKYRMIKEGITFWISKESTNAVYKCFQDLKEERLNHL